MTPGHPQNRGWRLVDDGEALSLDPAQLVTLAEVQGDRLATKRLISRDQGATFTKKGYGAGKLFRFQQSYIEDADGYFAFLAHISRQPRIFLLRDAPLPGVAGTWTQRLKHMPDKARPGCWKGTLTQPATRMCAFDFDAIDLSAGVYDEPELAAEMLRATLPPEFHDARCFVQLTSSAGLSGETHLRRDPAAPTYMRLWFWLDRGILPGDLKKMGRVWNLTSPHQIDNCMFDPVRVHYSANPLIEGAPDFLPKRTFVLDGEADEASPIIPAYVPKPPRQEGSGTAFDGGAVRFHLSQIGGPESFRTPLKRAIIAAWYVHGDSLDVARLHESAQVACEVALGRTPGKRHDVETYLDDDFYRVLQWARDNVQPRTARLDELVALERRDAGEDVKAIAAATEGRDLSRVEILEEQTNRLALEIAEIFAEVARHKETLAQVNGLRQCKFEVIDRYLEQKSSTQDVPIDKNERRRLRAKATRDAKKELGVPRFKLRPDNYRLSVSLGLGKTRSVLAEAARLAGGTLNIDYVAPNHKLIGEVVERFAEHGALYAVERGRAARDPQRRGDRADVPAWIGLDRGAMCPRHEALDAVSRVGISPGAICKSCPLRRSCSYLGQIPQLKQVRDEGGVIFGPSVYMRCARKVAHGDIVIADEDFVGQMVSTTSLPLEALIDAPALFTMVRRQDFEMVLAALDRVHEALSEHVADAVAWLVDLGGLATRLKDVIKALKAGRSDSLDIHGRMADDALVSKASAVETSHASEIIRLLRQLVKVMRRGGARAHSVAVRDGVVTLKTLARMTVPRRASLVVLDATSRLRPLELATGRKFHTIGISAPQNLDVTVVDTTGSKSAVLGADDQLVGMLTSIQAHARGEPVLVTAPKQVRERLEKVMPEGPALEHYGKLVGLNAYENVSDIALFRGDMESERELAQTAGAFVDERGGNVVSIRDWLALNPGMREHRRDGRAGGPRDYYMNRPTPGGIKATPWHPDPLVEDLRWQMCEGQMMQGLGRIRAVRSPTPKRALIVSNIDLPGIVPNRALSLQAMRAGRCREHLIDEYTYRLSKSEVIPLGRADMTIIAPDLFPHKESAKQALQMLHRTIKGGLAYIIYYIGCTPLNLALYRRAGQRGSPALCLVRAGADLSPGSNAWRELTALVGEIRSIERLKEKDAIVSNVA
jgi:hypothetical protein